MSEYNGIQFSESDVVNPSGFIPVGEYNPHNVRPWLLHDHGFVVAVVFADCLQDALDEAADAGKLDRYAVTADTYDDYGGEEEAWNKGAVLGNASELFDIESLGVEELPNPSFSWCALWDASQASKSQV